MDAYNQPTTTNPGKEVWQLVIHRSMSEISSIVEYLESSCVRFIGREHSPDEGCARNHCHFAIEYNYTKQALTKFINSKGIKGSDNFGILSRCKETKKEYDFEILSQYIIKAVWDDTIKFKGVSEDVVRAIYEKSKNYKGNGDTTSKDKNGKLDEWATLKRDGFRHFERVYQENQRENNYRTISYDEVKRYVMYWYYRKDGRMPLPFSYKRNSASLFFALSVENKTAMGEWDAMSQIMESY